MVSNRPRLESLTGLRFFAALLVFFHHAWGYTQYPRLTAWWPSFEPGFTAVGLFFVLSGFVLTWSYRHGTPASVLIGRRAAKIYPLHLAVLAGVAILAFARHVPTNWGAVWATPELLQAWFPDPIRYAINGPAWSISAEMFFYVCFPLVIKRVLSLRRPVRTAVALWCVSAVIAAITIATSSHNTADYLLYTFPLFRLSDFLIGMLLAASFIRGHRLRVPMPAATTLTLCALVATIVLSAVAHDTIPRGALVVLVVPMSAFILLSAAGADSRGARTLLNSRPLVALGNWSFAFYLIHLSMLAIFRPFVHGPKTALTYLAAAFLVSLGASFVAHKYVERPLERILRRRVEKRWRARLDTTMSAQKDLYAATQLDDALNRFSGSQESH